MHRGAIVIHIGCFKQESDFFNCQCFTDKCAAVFIRYFQFGEPENLILPEKLNKEAEAMEMQIQVQSADCLIRFKMMWTELEIGIEIFIEGLRMNFRHPCFFLLLQPVKIFMDIYRNLPGGIRGISEDNQPFAKGFFELKKCAGLDQQMFHGEKVEYVSSPAVSRSGFILLHLMTYT